MSKVKVKKTVQECLDLSALFQEFDMWGIIPRDKDGRPLAPAVDPLEEPFVQALVDNSLALEPTLRMYTELDKKSTTFQAYKAAELKVRRDLAVKDPTGKPVTANGMYVTENAAELAVALFELRNDSQHKKAYDKRQEKLNEVVELELTTVERQYLPKAGITISGRKQIDCFVVDNTTPPAEPEDLKKGGEQPEA